MSTNHAKLELTVSDTGVLSVLLTDTGSTNGTSLNGEPLARKVGKKVQPGDVVRMGSTKWTYTLLCER